MASPTIPTSTSTTIQTTTTITGGPVSTRELGELPPRIAWLRISLGGMGWVGNEGKSSNITNFSTVRKNWGRRGNKPSGEDLHVARGIGRSTVLLVFVLGRASAALFCALYQPETNLANNHEKKWREKTDILDQESVCENAKKCFPMWLQTTIFISSGLKIKLWFCCNTVVIVRCEDHEKYPFLQQCIHSCSTILPL